jgi:hypothetical protein
VASMQAAPTLEEYRSGVGTTRRVTSPRSPRGRCPSRLLDDRLARSSCLHLLVRSTIL